MKKIEYGFANDLIPKGSWEGIGINPTLHLTDGEYIGSVSIGKNNYIVSRIVEDKYGRYPQLLNNFLVSDAIYDVYSDGSGILYLDQEQSIEAMSLQNYLNSSSNKEKIHTSQDIINNINGVNRSNNFFRLMESEDRIIATSILHTVFEEKNEALKNCHSTMSDMQMQLNAQTKSSSR